LGHVAYAASKGAVHSLARTLARTGAPLKITANVIAPGITDTELLHATNSESFIESVSASVPLGIGHPEDIGAAAVFLASESARHITGITLDVNGGQIIR
jgi:3-oxoacyl-[acyl-carrier protein] reductase